MEADTNGGNPLMPHDQPDVACLTTISRDAFARDGRFDKILATT